MVVIIGDWSNLLSRLSARVVVIALIGLSCQVTCLSLAQVCLHRCSSIQVRRLAAEAVALAAQHQSIGSSVHHPKEAAAGDRQPPGDDDRNCGHLYWEQLS